MRFTSLAAAVGALATVALADTLTINTPTTSLQECHTVALTWSGGSAPYYVFVAGSTVGDVLEDLNSVATTATTGSWLISVPSGQTVIFAVTDSTGVTATTAQVTIAAGTSTACEGQISFSDADGIYTSTTSISGMATPAASTTAASGVASSASATAASASASKTSASSASKAASSASSVQGASSASSTITVNMSTASTALSAAASSTISTATATSSASAAAQTTAAAASAAGVVKGSVVAAALGVIAAVFA